MYLLLVDKMMGYADASVVFRRRRVLCGREFWRVIPADITVLIPGRLLGLRRNANLVVIGMISVRASCFATDKAEVGQMDNILDIKFIGRDENRD